MSPTLARKPAITSAVARRDASGTSKRNSADRKGLGVKTVNRITTTRRHSLRDADLTRNFITATHWTPGALTESARFAPPEQLALF